MPPDERSLTVKVTPAPVDEEDEQDTGLELRELSRTFVSHVSQSIISNWCAEQYTGSFERYILRQFFFSISSDLSSGP